MSPEWQEYYMNMAVAASRKSKDASTKVGAYLVKPDMTPASMGFNGFPKRLIDRPHFLNDPSFRAEKLRRMVHAESNCLRFNTTGSTKDYHLIVTRHPCEDCALEIVCTDIAHVWYEENYDYETRWHASVRGARELFDEAGIGVHRVR